MSEKWQIGFGQEEQDSLEERWKGNEEKKVNRKVKNDNFFAKFFFFIAIVSSVIGLVMGWKDILLTSVSRQQQVWSIKGKWGDLALEFCYWITPVMACLAFRRGADERVKVFWLLLYLFSTIVLLSIEIDLFNGNVVAQRFRWGAILERFGLSLIATILMHSGKSLESNSERVSVAASGNLNIAVCMFWGVIAVIHCGLLFMLPETETYSMVASDFDSLFNQVLRMEIWLIIGVLVLCVLALIIRIVKNKKKAQKALQEQIWQEEPITFFEDNFDGE